MPVNVKDAEQIFRRYEETKDIGLLLSMKSNPYDERNMPFHRRYDLRMNYGYTCYQSSMAYVLSDFLQGVIAYIEFRTAEKIKAVKTSPASDDELYRYRTFDYADFFIDIVNQLYFRTVDSVSRQDFSIGYLELLASRGRKVVLEGKRKLTIKEIAEFAGAVEDYIEEGGFLIADRSVHGELYDFHNDKLRRRVIKHGELILWKKGQFVNWFEAALKHFFSGHYYGNWDRIPQDLCMLTVDAESFRRTRLAGRNEFEAMLKANDLSLIIDSAMAARPGN